ncbi:MAG: DUF4255 domain-containing protein [Opitutus sp.]
MTATLRRTLQDALNSDVAGVKVTTLRPDAMTGVAAAAGVNIFLYQVTPNTALRNEVLPTRGSNTTVVARPRASLDLHYLISFYGNEAELEPQRLLGGVARTLNARPHITRRNIRDMLGDGAFAFLAGANLAEDEEVVRLTPAALSLEELSKLWSVFFQTPYSLSIAYQAGVVSIEADDVPRVPLPVRERTLTVLPFRSPTIEEVESNLGAQLPILAGATLTIRGRQLRSEVTRLHVSGDEVTPASIEDEEISVVLPATIRAGINSVQVVQKLMIGEPPTAHSGFDSNVAAFVLHPRITAITPGATFKVTVNPVARATQRTVLLLNNVTTGRAHTFANDPLKVDAAVLDFAVSGLDPGQYFVRVQVAGAESSLLDLNPASPTFKALINPQVVI